MSVPNDDYILELDGMTKKFGELVAVDDVSFGIEPGTFVGLIGPNGAGKSTLFDLITGVLSPTSGSVYFNGEDITNNALRKNAERGLVRTFQQTRVLNRMTVRENLLIASQLTDQPESRADELLEMIELTEKQNNLAGDLSFGQQKLVGICQVLMLEPELILLDEPLAGVNPTMENKILEMMRTFLEQGKTFVLVEHDMDVVMSECEDIVVMESGSVLTRGPPSEVKNDERVLEAYFGSDDDE
ncbi:ABC transporter ATP-binding protein [Halopenitus sp. POP-27]|uniref:ABC transporter ATP-binding protein n=1 Tax=Halopenitus sp. POP-27 TaxID=2994425 RepID=UPI002468C5F1|nr:ABC transporter ATP-binding protein [Halopenitus sp. POP-27]